MSSSGFGVNITQDQVCEIASQRWVWNLTEDRSTLKGPDPSSHFSGGCGNPMFMSATEGDIQAGRGPAVPGFTASHMCHEQTCGAVADVCFPTGAKSGASLPITTCWGCPCGITILVPRPGPVLSELHSLRHQSSRGPVLPQGHPQSKTKYGRSPSLQLCHALS